MFDVSWTELLVIVVVAVVVVGPKDLPRMMRVAGQWAGRARAMADQFRRSFEDMARQSELEQMRAEVLSAYDEKALKDMQRETDIMLGYLPPDDALIDRPSIAPPGLEATPESVPEYRGDAPVVPAEPAETAAAPASESGKES